jgi:hypothetical protein
MDIEVAEPLVAEVREQPQATQPNVLPLWSALALIFAIAAILLQIAYLSQQQRIEFFGSSFNERVTELLDKSKNVEKKIALIEMRDLARSAAIQSLETQSKEIKATLNILTSEAQSMRIAIAQQDAQLKNISSSVVAFKRSKHPSLDRKPEIVVSPPATLIVQPPFVLAGIDLLGGQQFVVTRSPNGAWISLMEGDTKDGWRLVKIDTLAHRAAFESMVSNQGTAQRIWLTITDRTAEGA